MGRLSAVPATDGAVGSVAVHGLYRDILLRQPTAHQIVSYSLVARRHTGSMPASLLPAFDPIWRTFDCLMTKFHE